MKIPTTMKLILKSLIIPILAIIMLDRFNLFDFIAFVPDGHRYDIGFTMYSAAIGIIHGVIENYIEQNQANIKCIFFSSKNDKDIKSNPLVVLSDDDMGVASINCLIEIEGNSEILKKKYSKFMFTRVGVITGRCFRSYFRLL